MGEYVAIDECQYAKMIQVLFNFYNPSKPAKYGILFMHQWGEDARHS